AARIGADLLLVELTRLTIERITPNRSPSRNLGLGPPLIGKLFVGKCFDEDSADDGASLETDLFAVFGVVPIGQGDTGRSFIHPNSDGVHDSFEISRIRGKCCGPD